jgi:hypothetical protein
MGKEINDGLLYLRTYPQLRKWVNQCVACQRLGYKPEMPEQITPGVAAKTIRRFFPEMEVNNVGLCEQCAIATRGRKK